MSLEKFRYLSKLIQKLIRLVYLSDYEHVENLSLIRDKKLK
jgi:hypothetical protein